MAVSGQAKSLEQLERESERNRAAVASAVDDLRTTIVDEISDVRRKASLQYWKDEVSGYASDASRTWFAKLQESVRANPLRSLGIGAGLALPLVGVARRVPAPLLLIGAGIALTRSNTSGLVAGVQDSLAGVTSRLGDVAGQVTDTASGLAAKVGTSSDGGSAVQSVKAAAASNAARAADSLGDVWNAGADMASQASDKGAAMLRSGSDMVSDARSYAARGASRTQARASDIFHSNPLLVAGAGLAAGAFLAALIPATRTESRLLEGAGLDLKQRASDLIDDGYQAASASVAKIYDGVVDRTTEQGLTPDSAKAAASGLVEKVGAVLQAAAGLDDHGAGEAGKDAGKSNAPKTTPRAITNFTGNHRNRHGQRHIPQRFGHAADERRRLGSRPRGRPGAGSCGRRCRQAQGRGRAGLVGG